MDASSISQKDITSLIDHLLKTKDPAEVGLRRILKNKAEADQDFPVRALSFDEFGEDRKKGVGFTEEEKHILRLEKEVRRLKETLSEQRVKAEKERGEAYEKGKEEGFAAGKTDGEQSAGEVYKQQLAHMQDKIAGLISGWEEAREEMLLGGQRDLSRLACEIARKLIHTELQQNGDLVLAVVKRALAYLADREGLVIRVSPEDWETVSGNKDFWKPVQERLAEVSIVADDHVTRGGCIIESASGQVDARLETQFEEIRDLVEKTWESIQGSTQSMESSSVNPSPTPPVSS